MSFRCSKCHQAQPVGAKPVTVVVATRTRIYPVRLGRDGTTMIDKGGVGREIVHEDTLCIRCAPMPSKEER